MDSERPDRAGGSTSLAACMRDASVRDAAAIEAVHYASREAVYRERVEQWPPAGPDRAGRVRRWMQWLSSPEIECLVLERDEGIIGFVTIRPAVDPDLDPSTIAEMPTLYVRPDVWRSGYGTALCTAALKRAKAHGFRWLTLWVLEINEPARAFYEAYGFEPDGARKLDEGSVEGLMADRFRIDLGRAAGT